MVAKFKPGVQFRTFFKFSVLSALTSFEVFTKPWRSLRRFLQRKVKYGEWPRWQVVWKSAYVFITSKCLNALTSLKRWVPFLIKYKYRGSIVSWKKRFFITRHNTYITMWNTTYTTYNAIKVNFTSYKAWTMVFFVRHFESGEGPNNEIGAELHTKLHLQYSTYSPLRPLLTVSNSTNNTVLRLITLLRRKFTLFFFNITQWVTQWHIPAMAMPS